MLFFWLEKNMNNWSKLFSQKQSMFLLGLQILSDNSSQSFLPPLYPNLSS